MQEVWVFHGTGGRLTSGVFSTREQAEDFIASHFLSGSLIKYPLGLSAYDWALLQKHFEPRKPEQFEPGFIQRFTSTHQEHYQYLAGKVSPAEDSSLG